MIKSILILAKKDIELILRNKQLVISCLFLPILMFFILTNIFSVKINKEQMVDSCTLGIVDCDKSIVTKMLIDNLKNSGTFNKHINIKVIDKDKAEEALSNDDIIAVINIPKNFAKGIYYCENPSISIELKENNSLRDELIKKIFESYASYISVAESSINGSYDNIRKINIPIKTKEEFNENVSLKLISVALSSHNNFKKVVHNDIPLTSAGEYYAIGFIIVFIMYIGLALGISIIREKNNAIIKRTLCSNIKPYYFILSKGIVFFLLSYVYAILFLAGIYFKNGIYLGNSLGRMALFLIFVVLFIISLFIFLGVLFNEEESYVIFSNLFILILTLFGGSFIPIYMLPASIQKISFFIPNYQIIKGYALLVNSYGIEDIRNIIFYLIILSILSLFIGIVKCSKDVKR